jgi:hypothetical protein
MKRGTSCWSATLKRPLALGSISKNDGTLCRDADDVNYLLGLAKRGYTIGIDHVFYGAVKSLKGQPDYVIYLHQVPWQKRAGYVKQLIEGGFGDKIFLSNDWELERETMNPDAFSFNNRKTIPYLRNTQEQDSGNVGATPEFGDFFNPQPNPQKGRHIRLLCH